MSSNTDKSGRPFTDLSISKEMLNVLADMGYHTMTEVQAKAIPLALEGRDILAQAKTGSGKTAAFGIGMIENLKVEKFRIQGLVLCPTRELAVQVSDELRRLARSKPNCKITTITGGTSLSRQEHGLSHLAHIIVGTPGRVLKLLKREAFSMKHVRTIVLDEADRMLDMGFIEQVNDILQYANNTHQTLCFSATFPDEIVKLSKSGMNNPADISVKTAEEELSIEQNYIQFDETGKKDQDYQAAKLNIIELVINNQKPESLLIFCNTKQTVNGIKKGLIKKGYPAVAITGDLDQPKRTEMLIRFTNGSSRILIATDLAARGLDIKDLDLVINYDMPFETETYIHRIGRTGRAGKSGHAYSLIHSKEQFRLDAINEQLNRDFIIEAKNTIDHTADDHILEPEFTTISVNGGRKQKLSAGDLLGALTASPEINGSDIGKIDRLERISYIAVAREKAGIAYQTLNEGKIKGKKYIARLHK